MLASHIAVAISSAPQLGDPGEPISLEVQISKLASEGAVTHEHSAQVRVDASLAPALVDATWSRPPNLVGDLDSVNLPDDLGIVATGIAAFGGAGDLDGDGLDDVLLGGGVASVVFGRDFPDGVPTDEFQGRRDLYKEASFTLRGGSDFFGYSLSVVGDINADGIDDFVAGAPTTDNALAAVVFGSDRLGLSGEIDVSQLNGTNGFVIPEINVRSGLGVSVDGIGDVNGDGIYDFIVGAPGYDSGSAYVIFGGPTIGAGGSLDLSQLDGSNGFELTGMEDGDRVGTVVGGAGDVNGDGFSDLFVTAPEAGIRDEGVVIILLGSQDVGGDGKLLATELDGQGGSTIGAEQSVGVINVSRAGDINGDGFDDLLIGLPVSSRTPSDGGEVHVVFGSSAWGDMNAELDDVSSIVYRGLLSMEAGTSLAGPGDINADGIDDFIIGSPHLAFLVYGDKDIAVDASVIELAEFTESQGVKFVNDRRFDGPVGAIVSGAGDLNRDGIEDMVLGGSSPSYVIFGQGSVSGTGDIGEVVTLGLDSPLTYRVTGTIPEDATGNVTITASAQAIGEEDSDPSNNSASQTIMVNSLPGDLDGDNFVGFGDFLILASNFGRTTDVSHATGDLDDDGQVSFADFLILRENFGRTIS